MRTTRLTPHVKTQSLKSGLLLLAYEDMNLRRQKGGYFKSFSAQELSMYSSYFRFLPGQPIPVLVLSFPSIGKNGHFFEQLKYQNAFRLHTILRQWTYSTHALSNMAATSHRWLLST